MTRWANVLDAYSSVPSDRNKNIFCIRSFFVCDCQPYMSLTRRFSLGDICVQAIENGHADTVVTLIEAKVNINPKNVVSVRWGMPAHLDCVLVSLCVCRLTFLRCYTLLQEGISMLSSHCSKPELTSTPKIKCVLVSPVCGLMTVPAMPMTFHQSRRYRLVMMRLCWREGLKITMSSQRSSRFLLQCWCIGGGECVCVCGEIVSYVYAVRNSTHHHVML